MISISSCAPPIVHLRYLLTACNHMIGFAAVGVEYYICHQGRIEYRRPPRYIWGCLLKPWLVWGIPQLLYIFQFVWSLFMGELRFFCNFGQCKSGVDKMNQYTPFCRLPRLYLVSNATYLYLRIWQTVLSRSQ